MAALEEIGADYELSLVDTSAGQHRSPEYLRINPNGLLPTLVTQDGAALCESAAILLYLCDRHPEAKLAPEPRDPWARIYTKRPEAIGLTLLGPKNAVALGRLSRFGNHPELDGSKPEYDVIKLSFRTHEDLHRDDLAAFLKEHLAIRMRS